MPASANPSRARGGKDCRLPTAPRLDLCLLDEERLGGDLNSSLDSELPGRRCQVQGRPRTQAPVKPQERSFDAGRHIIGAYQDLVHALPTQCVRRSPFSVLPGGRKLIADS